MQEIFITIYNQVTFETLLKFLVVYFVIVWIAILVWVVKDISNRTNSLILQILSIALIIFLSPLGVFIYLLFRPGKTLFEKYYEEIEDNLDLMTEIIHEKMGNSDNIIHCMYCNEVISPDFKYCPHCKKKVKKECKGCNKMIYVGWQHCPYCGEEQKKKKHKKKEKTQD